MRGGSFASSSDVLADRIRGVVGCKYERDEFGESIASKILDGFFDHRVCMLQAEAHRIPIGLNRIQLALQLVSL